MSIIHKLRGKASTRGYPKEIKKRVIDIYKKQYWDYAPSLYAEMSAKHHNISISNDPYPNSFGLLYFWRNSTPNPA
ncbi:MAG: hypothetical protein ACM34O_13020 [Ignavibacteria bacterium]